MTSSLLYENPTYMTSFDISTVFTSETEQNSQLPFLDTIIQRNSDRTISVRVYRKPTHTHTPIPQIHISPSSQSKEKCHHVIISQSKEHSNHSDQEKEENHLTAVLQANCYPKKFISNTGGASQLPRLSRRNYFNVKGTSEQLKRIFNNDSINCTFYTTTTLHTLVPHAKDPLPSEQKNNIVHKYDCKDCEAVYFGESK